MSTPHPAFFALRLIALTLGLAALTQAARANPAPSMSVIDNQAMLTNSTLSLTVSGGDAKNDLTLTATSDNQALLPDSNIWVSASGETRTVVIKAAGSSGAAQVMLTAADSERLTSIRSFIVAVCDSTNSFDNTAALNEALGCGATYGPLTNANTRFAPGSYNIAGLIHTTRDNQRIYADRSDNPHSKLTYLNLYFPTNKITWGLLIGHSGCDVEDIGFVSNQHLLTTYLMLVRSTNLIANNLIKNCGFYGGAGNYLRDEGTSTDITGNTFDCDGNWNVPEALSINSDSAFNISGNRFHNISGFSVKTRGGGALPGATAGMPASGNIISNYFENPMSAAAAPFIPGVSEYTFTGMTNHSQAALWVTGAVSNQCWGGWGANESNWTWSVSGDSISAHLNYPDIIPTNSVLRLLGWRSIEHINIDGGSSNVTIRFNTFRISGDSAITVCNDSGMAPAANIKCENNTFQDIACAGIYFQIQSGGCAARNNTFLRTGLSNIRSHYDPFRKEWNGQIPWSTCIFDPTATATNSSIDYGAPNFSNVMIEDPLSPACSRTSNNLGLESPWCHQNPF